MVIREEVVPVFLLNDRFLRDPPHSFGSSYDEYFLKAHVASVFLVPALYIFMRK